MIMIARIFALIALFCLAAPPAAAQVVTNNTRDLPSVALPSPEWTVQPVDGDKAPSAGGRAYQRYRIARASSVLASFDTVARATFSAQAAAFTDDTTSPLYGSSALTFTPTATGTVQVRPIAALATGVTVTGNLVRWWIRPVSNVGTRLSVFTIKLYSTGSPSSPGADYHQTTVATDRVKEAAGGKSGWSPITLPSNHFTAVGAGANMAAITFAVVEMATDSTATPLSISIGNVEVVPKGITKAKFIIAFDDMYPSTIAYASRAMARYGFPGVLYPSPLIDLDKPGKLTSQTLKNLQDNLGWQIASQAYSTEQATGAGGFDGMTRDQQTAEISKLRNMQNALGLSGGAHGSAFSNVGTSYGFWRQHFRSLRGYYFGEFFHVETYPWGDPMRIRAMGAGEFQWGNASNIYSTYWKNHVDRAISQTGVGFLVFHNGLDGSLSNWRPGFDSLLAYLDANRASIDVVTVEDLESP